MWWQGKSPTLDSSSREFKTDQSSTSSCYDDIMIATNSEEFRKLPLEGQTEELFILIQRLLPVVKRVDSLTDSVASLSERMTNMEGSRGHSHRYKVPKNAQHTDDEVQDDSSDSMYRSFTSLAGSEGAIPDPFIIKRSREINK